LNEPKNKPALLIDDDPVPPDMAKAFEVLGKVAVDIVSTNNDHQLRLTEARLPIEKEQLALQKEQLGKNDANWNKATDATIKKDKREFSFRAVLVGAVLLFLMTCAVIFITKGEYQLGLTVISLMIGFVGGFGTGLNWQKAQEKITGEGK